MECRVVACREREKAEREIRQAVRARWHHSEDTPCAEKAAQSYILDLPQRWEIIITNSHSEKLPLCVITTGRAILSVIIKARFLLPSLGQLRSARQHVNKGHPPKRSG